NKKGWKITLEGLIGLVLGIAFVVLIFLVLFKLVGVFVPEEEQATPITVFNEINGYKDNEQHIIIFKMTPHSMVVGFNNDQSILNLKNFGVYMGTSKKYIANILELNKPVSCKDSSCICGCVFGGETEVLDDIKNIYSLCKGQPQCIILNEKISGIGGYVDVDNPTKRTYESNPKYPFFIFNDNEEIKKLTLFLVKSGDKVSVK
ncbi:hypothetical protein HY498_00200, partial [Candidatus Woesearchaeota archaeon]|nr:hypothetical protein [Candidatus Woesearchaeota archaeon]